jgi:porin
MKSMSRTMKRFRARLAELPRSDGGQSMMALTKGLVGLVTAFVMSGLCAHTVWAADSMTGGAAPAALGDRTHLLGDLGGARSQLASHGIIFDFQATQFYQGVVDGSAGTNDWQYGVKGDYFLTVIGEKAGLWKGIIFNVHAETHAGDDVNTLTGFSPGNAAMLYPNLDNDTTAITQAIAIQMVDEQWGLLAGKVNAFDLVDMIYHTGRGIDGFMNSSLVMPFSLAATVPASLATAGALKFKGKEVQGALVAYDPNNCATTSCLDPLFGDGAAVAGLWKFYTGTGHDGARSGYVSFGGTWSGKEYTVVDPQSLAFVPGEGLSLTETQERWSIFSVVDQPLWTDPSDSNRALRFKGMYTITDGESTPVEWTATAALELSAPFRNRDKDAFAVGYFHNELSDGFKNTVGPLVSVAATVSNRTRTRIAIEDTDGFEAYYKAQLTPWFALTGDLQVITATLSTEDTKLVTGFRGNLNF